MTRLRPSSIAVQYHFRFIFATSYTRAMGSKSNSTDIYRRLIGLSAITDKVHAVAGVDLNGIIRRLILFDTYILKSIQLKEFPFLITELGFNGTMQLLESPAFEIECEVMAVGQTGQIEMPDRVGGTLPPLSYALSGICSADRSKDLHRNFQPLHQIPHLTLKQVIKLKKAVSAGEERSHYGRFRPEPVVHPGEPPVDGDAVRTLHSF